MPTKPQPISGVSPTAETVITTRYPSIAAMGLGRALGKLYDAIPLRIGTIKLSYVLFTLPTSPLAVTLYAIQKLFGQRYQLTNRRVRILSMLGTRVYGQVNLTEIGDVAIDEQPGQAFYKAGDLVILGTGGNTLLRLTGVTRPDVFRQTILEARTARVRTEASLAVIKARKTAAAGA